ncbi:MAG: RnfABCDGE type electron transport complex subunit D [Deltaproteobacteria bacterium]|nr:MAG: RnfABCDGE type electron transport complex subunit D [Deltaproteobacteria bacterium]
MLNPIYHLLMGGSSFAMVYMCTCPITAPDMTEARWVYAILIGSLTVVIRVFNPAFPEGVGLAVLFMNCFAPLLDEIVVRTKLKKRIPNVQ